MVYIVHGENFVKSRAQVINQQKKLGNIVKTELDISQISPADFRSAVSSGDLFGGIPFVVLDITAAGRMNLDEYFEVIKKAQKKTHIVILSGKELSKTNKFLKEANALGAKVIKNDNDLDVNIFKFVDAVFYKNRKATYTELEKLMTAEENPIYILSMVIYGARNIALIKFKAPSASKMNPFAKSKAKKQAEKFTEEKIKEILECLYELDKKSKNGEVSQEIIIPLAIETVLN